MCLMFTGIHEVLESAAVYLMFTGIHEVLESAAVCLMFTGIHEVLERPAGCSPLTNEQSLSTPGTAENKYHGGHSTNEDTETPLENNVLLIWIKE